MNVAIRLWIMISTMLLTCFSLCAFKEIELKIQLNAQQQKKFEGWLKKNAQDEGSVMQEEYYFDNPAASFKGKAVEGFIDAVHFLRVRMTPKGDYVCHKFRCIDPATGKSTHREEHETKVADGKIMIKIFESLGFTDKTPVKKVRKTYRYKDFEIALDDVEGVGKFIEVELKREEDDVKKGTADIYQFLKEVGITELTRHHCGYVHMIWNPGYNFGEQEAI